MIGVMVGYQERFAQQVLPLTPAEGLVEVGGWLGDEGFEDLEVFADSGDGRVPGVSGGRLGRLGPVAVRPFHGLITAGGRSGKINNVALSETEVLENLPSRVRQSGRDFAAMLRGEIGDNFIKGCVRLPSTKKPKELLANFFGGRVSLRVRGGGFRHIVPSPEELDARGVRQVTGPIFLQSGESHKSR